MTEHYKIIHIEGMKDALMAQKKKPLKTHNAIHHVRQKNRINGFQTARHISNHSSQ